VLDYQILLPQQYKSMPWRNGLGNTLEIERYDDKDGLCFRISQASVVADGLFSDFSHLQRTLVLLSGKGITLDHLNQQQNPKVSYINKLIKPLDMAHFNGGDKTLATLHDGQIEDLNIMVRQADTTANVTVMDLGRHLVISDADKRLYRAFYANRICRLHLNTNKSDSYVVELPEHSLLLLKVGPRLTHRFNCGSISGSNDERYHTQVTSITVSKGSGVFIDIASLTN